mgnify:CR=1 FL=1
MKLTAPKRVAVHSLLLVGSVLFLFPFVWLVVTSLKPIEQTMRMPPEWLPRAFYATVQGERMKVRKDEREILEPSVIVTAEMPPTAGKREPAKERMLLPAAKNSSELDPAFRVTARPIARDTAKKSRMITQSTG